MKKLVVLLTLTTACGTTSAPITYDVETTRAVPVTETLALDVFSPTVDDTFPAVVLIHGGSWYGGEKESLDSFARLLASKGLVVYNASYTVGGNGGGFPTSYQELVCALATASELADLAPLTVVGHSAGAHLGATVAMSGDQFASDQCTSDSPFTVGAFVGLAGPYDAGRYGPLLVNWFGTSIQDDPEIWRLGGPYGYVESAARIPMVLVHGDRDQVVQLGFTYDFENALLDAGFDVTVEIIDAADHQTILDPLGDGERVADIVLDVASMLSN